MQNDIKGPLTPKTSQEIIFLSEEHEKDKKESLVKKSQKGIETEKENIGLNEGSPKETGINPEKFNGPAQKPKTANKAFGGISDFVLFFENRNPEMKEFAKDFENIEKMDSKLSIAELNRVIVPKIDECLNHMYQKIKGTTKPKMRKLENKYAKLFKNSFKTLEEFYKQVFHAYTINGFLYKRMNKYLRNENWMELDALLPYVYCLFKAFLWGPSGLTGHESFEALKAKSKENKLVLYRGADFDDESLKFYDPTKIKNFSWNGVISTSLMESVTKKFQGDSSKRPILIIIEIDFEDLQPEDLNALYLAGFSEYPKEEEVVLPPGSIFELLEINKEKPEVKMRLKLVTNAKDLAHKGQFMHGMLQAIMRNENVLKIVCLKEKELSRALKHCQGNRLIKEIEFCFCIFNKKSIRAFIEVIPTIENMTSLTFNIVIFEEDCRLDEMLECLEMTRIKELKVFAALCEKRHLEAMVKGIKYLGSLEYLKLELEEDYQMDASLFQDLLVAACQYLNPKCVFDVDIGTRYNLMIKGANHNDFERLDIMKAINQYWPSFWCHPPKSTDETKFMSENSQVKQHPKTAQTIKEKSLSDRETHTIKILNSEGLKDERNENIEIIESSRGMRKYCLEGRTQQLESLNSLHLCFGKNEISNQEMILFCSGIQHLQSLKTLHLIFDEISDEEVAILSCQGIQKLSSLTSLSLSLKSCSKIRDKGLKALGYEGIRHLTLLTSLTLDFTDCYKIRDQGLMHLSSEGIRYLPLLTSLHLNFESCDAITDEGVMYLSSEGIRYLPLLTSLHLNFERCYAITDEGVMYLSSEGIRYLPLLTSLALNFARLSQITDKGLMYLSSEGIRYLPLLTSLHLNFERRYAITDEGVMYLSSEGIRYLPLLTSLTLNFASCSEITDKGLMYLSSEGIRYLPLLTSLTLNFEGCSEITDEGLMHLSSEGIQYLPLLTSLTINFEGCSEITDEGLMHLSSEGIRYLPLLTSLTLSFVCCSEITDKGLMHLSSEGIRYLPLLTSLTLNFMICRQITDKGFMHLSSEGIRYLPLLTSLALNFEGCSEITDKGLMHLSSEGIRYLPLLTSLALNFASCSEITDKGLMHLSSEGIRYLPLLTSLTLSFVCCSEITDKGLMHLSSEGIRYLPLLTSLALNFARLSQITDKGLMYLSSEGIRYLPLLTSLALNFARLSQITDKGLMYLSSEGIRYLPLLTSLTLNFAHLSQITDKGLMHLSSEGIRYLSLLTSLTLNFEGCSQISDKGLMHLSSEGILYLPLLTSLDLTFTKDYIFQKKIESILSMIQSKIESLNIHQYQVVQRSNRIYFSRPALKNLSNSNQSASFVDYHVEPGFYFKEQPFKCEKSIHKLLKNHSPIPFKDFNETLHENCLSKEAQKSYQATFHLNFESISLNDDDISNLKETATSWQDVKTLSIIFNDYPLLAPQRFQSYWNIFQYFNSIVNLSLSSNEVSFPLNKRLPSLFDEKIKNLKSLKSINFIFPNVTLNQKVGRNIFEASSSFALTFLTKKKFEMKKADFKINKPSVQSTLKKKSQIFKIKSQEIQMSLQSNLILSEIFDEMDLNHTPIQHIQSISSSQIDGESQFQSALNENAYKRHFVCQRKITNSQEKFKPFLSRDITFSENQNISIQDLNFQEVFGFKFLLELNLNLSRRNDVTNERLQTLSAKISDLESLRILNLSFYGCRRITDEGLLSLSSQGLKQLRKLTELSLDFGLCDEITDKGLDCLGCEGIKHLEFLTKLSLNFEWCPRLETLSFKGIGFLKRLTELHLNFNCCTGITDIGPDWISCGLQNLKLLTILSIDFGCDRVHNLDIQSLSKGIQHLESLIDLHLNFSHCTRITDLGLEWLSHGLQNLKLLTSLNLSFDGPASSHLTSKGLQILCCEGIRHLNSLVSLYLNVYIRKGISDEGLENLCCEGIQHLDKLTSLVFISRGENIITDRGIKNLAFKAMSKLISLEYLQLPLMQTVTSSSSIAEAFRNILIYFGLLKMENL